MKTKRLQLMIMATLFLGVNIGGASIAPVSYTHLDVYKRQPIWFAKRIVGDAINSITDIIIMRLVHITVNYENKGTILGGLS